ncbi:MAG: disulfide bond formation protein B [Candidatus Pacebacteria bacterium]|nr:disulfide bond formation protein B [Candidatus Paceibacterota bacterium]
MSFEAVHNLNVFLGIGIIIIQFFSVLALFILFFGPKKNSFLDFIDKHFLILGFLISLFSALFSMVYSEIVGFLPCMLCWYQRIFIFPQVFLFGMALWNKDRKVIHYSIPLLLVGFVISAYQVLVYYFTESSTLPCDASGVSCYQHLVSEFGGYISIPMMGLTVFISMLALVSVVHFYGKRKLLD